MVPEPELDIKYVFDFLHLTFYSFTFYNKFVEIYKKKFLVKQLTK